MTLEDELRDKYCEAQGRSLKGKRFLKMTKWSKNFNISLDLTIKLRKDSVYRVSQKNAKVGGVLENS